MDGVVEAVVLVYGIYHLLGCIHSHCRGLGVCHHLSDVSGREEDQAECDHGAAEQYGDHDGQAPEDIPSHHPDAPPGCAGDATGVRSVGGQSGFIMLLHYII